MGLVDFKNKSTGAIVKVEFPLAEMPALVEFSTDDGKTSHHAAKADFLTDYEQVLPELPKTDPTNVPEMPVTSTPGNPIASPAAPPPVPEGALTRVEAMVSSLGRYISSELGGLKAAFDRLEAHHPQVMGALERVEKLVLPTVEKDAAEVLAAARESSGL